MYILSISNIIGILSKNKLDLNINDFSFYFNYFLFNYFRIYFNLQIVFDTDSINCKL